jgi:hypothetical protein
MKVTAPFLTDVDPRASVKGSRDPLGLQSIWTSFGRHVVGNLTTVSTSLRDFTVTILGYYFVDRLRRQGAGDGDLACFLKWEQLAGYARSHFNRDHEFRGTERVQKRLSDSATVVLSAARDHQILSNQKIYGLWGLYSVPSRASGLLASEPTRLSPQALEIVDRLYLPMLARAGFRDGEAILHFLAQPRVKLDLSNRHEALGKAVAALLSRRLRVQEVDFYRDHLLYGGPADSTQGLQRELADVITSAPKHTEIKLSPAVFRSWEKAARRDSRDATPLSEALARIRNCESVLAPAAVLFSFALSFHGKRIDELVGAVRDQWGEGLRTVDRDAVASIGSYFADEVGDEARQRFEALARALAGGDFGAAFEILLQQNAVMNERGSGPWAEARNGRLDVRFRDETGRLPKRDELPLWRFPTSSNPCAPLPHSSR